MTAINPTAACSNCGGAPVLTMCDRDGVTADIIGGWCKQCGKLGPMRSEVADACAAWDADNAKPVERDVLFENVGDLVTMARLIIDSSNHGRIYMKRDEIDDMAKICDEIENTMIVRKGGKA